MKIVFETKLGGKDTAKVTSINVKKGDKINKDDNILKIENGKINQIIKSPVSGTVENIEVAVGDEISLGKVLINILETDNKTEDVNGLYFFEEKNSGKETAKVTMIIKAGDIVKAGDILVKLENGKLNQIIKAKDNGIVEKVFVKVGDEIKLGEKLILISGNKQDIITPENNKNKKVKEIETDIAIIGGGPGGYVAALYASKFNKKIVVIEANKVGGTCLNVGCIPTKTLVTAAERYENIKESSEYGINCENISFNLQQAIRKKDEVVNTLVSGIHSLYQSNGIQLIKGFGSFVDQNTISVTGEENYLVKAKDIIIATGSKPVKLPLPGMDLPVVMDSTEILSNETLPSTLTIIGGGVIGMEFAFIYASFGVKVNVVEYMDHILFTLEEDIFTEIEKIALDKGINLYTSSKVKEVKKSENGKAIVIFENNGQDKCVVSDLVLSAVGRVSNMEGLNLDKIGVTLNDKGRGIKVNEKMETNIPHVYAVGDVNNIIQLAHAASHQGIIAVSNILGENKLVYPRYLVPSVIYISPEIATIGKSEKQLFQENIKYKVSKFPYAANGKAQTMSKTKGFIKLIMEEETHTLIGATILGNEASNLISSFCIAIQNGLKVENITEAVYPHPTLGEMIQEAGFGLTIGPLHSH